MKESEGKKLSMAEKMSSDKALRYNEGKVRMSFLSMKGLLPMVYVLMFGAIKYAKNNWKKDMDLFEILESMYRHVDKLRDGEAYDEDTGLHHIGAIMCNGMFFSYHMVKQFGEQAIFKPGTDKDELISKCNESMKQANDYSEIVGKEYL